jgi:hypothetical protein
MGINDITTKDFQRFKQIAQSTHKDVRGVAWKTDTIMGAITKSLDKNECSYFSNLLDTPAYLLRGGMFSQTAEQATKQTGCLSMQSKLYEITKALSNLDSQSLDLTITPSSMQMLESNIKMRSGR